MPQKVVARRGQNGVKVIRPISCNPKEGTIFIASVTMDHNDILPFGIVAKGKTSRSEKKYHIGFSSNDFITHSQSGWTTAQVMQEYLVWLWDRMGKKLFCLILDVFEAHRDDSVKELAEDLGIQLIYVPACGTGEFQPLDRRLFGIVKKISWIR